MTRLLAIALILAFPAHAHYAPSGWAYSAVCCSGSDCHHVTDAQVTVTTNGYRVRLLVGEHPALTADLDEVVPFGDTRIKISLDQDYHVCTRGGVSVRCLYVPAMSG